MSSQKDQQRSKSVVKIAHSLASPFPEPSWYVSLGSIARYSGLKVSRPQIQPDDQQTILDLLCMLLADLGQYHRSLSVSKGKRRRWEKSKQENKELSESKNLPRPEIKSYVLIGFNEVQRHLDTMILEKAGAKVNTTNDTDDGSKSQGTGKELVAVFVDRSNQPLIMTRHLPNMMATAASNGLPLWLVTLPGGVGIQLGETVGIPRLTFCALLANAPGSIPLLHYLKEHIQPIQSSRSLSATFLPLKVETYSIEVESKLSGKTKRQQQRIALDIGAEADTRRPKKCRRRKHPVSQQA